MKSSKTDSFDSAIPPVLPSTSVFSARCMQRWMLCVNVSCLLLQRVPGFTASSDAFSCVLQDLKLIAAPCGTQVSCYTCLTNTGCVNDIQVLNFIILSTCVYMLHSETYVARLIILYVLSAELYHLYEGTIPFSKKHIKIRTLGLQAASHPFFHF